LEAAQRPIVTANSAAVLYVVDPSLTLSSIGTTSTFTVYQTKTSDAGPSMLRRAAMPAPTKVCGNRASCPALLGGFGCIDIEVDLYSRFALGDHQELELISWIAEGIPWAVTQMEREA
jgi:hypothetical protein